MARWDSSFDEFKVKGNQLVDKVKELIQEGNARNVSIRKDGRVLLDFPLSIGVGGATAAIMFAPILAAVGAMAALVSEVEVVVERDDSDAVEVVAETTNESDGEE